MGIPSFDIGDLVRVGNHTGTNSDGTERAPFTNALGATTDPTTVTLQFEKQTGETLVYGWPAPGADGLLEHQSAGRFYFDVSLDESGLWAWRLAGTGAVETAQEGVLYVLLSTFA